MGKGGDERGLIVEVMEGADNGRRCGNEVSEMEYIGVQVDEFGRLEKRCDITRCSGEIGRWNLVGIRKCACQAEQRPHANARGEIEPAGIFRPGRADQIDRGARLRQADRDSGENGLRAAIDSVREQRRY